MRNREALALAALMGLVFARAVLDHALDALERKINGGAHG
jgi:hypothetical protein